MPLIIALRLSVADMDDLWPLQEPPLETPAVPEEALEEEEDVSDAAYASRHAPCEVSEKRRFSTAAAAVGGRRSRSTGSTARASESLDPTPASPGTPLVVEEASRDAMDGEDQPSLRRNSSASSVKELRSRASSFSRGRAASISWDGGMEEEEVVSPWVPRAFPLSEEDQEDLSRDRPRGGGPSRRVVAMATTPPRPPSDDEEDMALSTSSDDPEEEDARDDPEWTVVSEQPPKTTPPAACKQPPSLPATNGGGLVLKLAKK